MWPPRTMAITDRARLREAVGRDDDDAMVAYAAAVAAAGVDAIQIRDRASEDGRLYRLVSAVLAVVGDTRCRVLVNERAHVAWSSGAHGVHLRSDGMSVQRLRDASPVAGLIGRSVHDADAVQAVDEADYALFGTVFASASKEPGAPVAGVAALQRWAAECSVPVLAVGGITIDRCAAVRRAGARGVAAIDLFARAYAAGGRRLAATVREMHAMLSDGEQTA